MARPIVLILHLFWLANAIIFRKDYSPPSSLPSRPYIALEVLVDICQEFGNELINGPAESIPRVAPSEAVWLNFEDDPLVMTEAERAQSSGPAMSAMMAILRMSMIVRALMLVL